MDFRKYGPVAAISLVAVLVSCNQRQRPEDLQEKTAQATAEVKRDAKAVAAGIREGWSRDRPLNLNTATKDEFLRLPGVSEAEADKVIEARPFNAPHELVTRRIMTKSEYDKIADRITVKR